MSTTTTVPAKTVKFTSTNETRLSASCQQIVSEDFSSPTKARVVIRSCIADPDLLPAVSQHVCHNVTLTPAGLYTDMASVVAQYMWKANRGQDAEDPGISVNDMEVHKTYIISMPQDERGQWLEMEATLSVPECSSGDIIDGSVHCQFRSIRPDGAMINDLAHCSVTYEWAVGWLSDWSNHASLVKTKIENLRSRARKETSGEVQLVQRDSAYKLFKSFVEYGPKYQNMAEVVFDTETLEATSELAFSADLPSDGTGPFYHDGSCHVSGFVANAVDPDTDKNAYISHGFDAMKLSSKFCPYPGANIRNYVRMRPLPSDKTVVWGDVYVLQDDEIVGMWEGVKFKRIPRKVLNIFLAPPKKK